MSNDKTSVHNDKPVKFGRESNIFQSGSDFDINQIKEKVNYFFNFYFV